MSTVDDWDADLSATGFRGTGSGSPILYFSSWKQPPGTLYWEIENADGDAVEEGTVSDSDALGLISRQLLHGGGR